MAAIQARRMGRTALILEPGTHVGGMTTGGLGYTDIGAPDSVGGLAAEFYRRVGKWYPSTGGGPRYAFAPSVASAVLKRMLAEAGVPVRTGVRLRAVDRRGNRIVALVAEDVVDPYVVPGKRASGLLPGIAAKPLAPHGSGDRLVQAYAYRMCITRAADRIPFGKPGGYDPGAYELLRRHITPTVW
jgi:hypothetical protein